MNGTVATGHGGRPCLRQSVSPGAKNECGANGSITGTRSGSGRCLPSTTLLSPARTQRTGSARALKVDLMLSAELAQCVGVEWADLPRQAAERPAPNARPRQL